MLCIEIWKNLQNKATEIVQYSGRTVRREKKRTLQCAFSYSPQIFRRHALTAYHEQPSQMSASMAGVMRASMAEMSS